MINNLVERYIKKIYICILDQVFSSLLIFGINFYFAYQSQFNEVGIFALIFFTSIGFAQVLQQAILERPFLIKKNVFKYLKSSQKIFDCYFSTVGFNIIFILW